MNIAELDDTIDNYEGLEKHFPEYRKMFRMIVSELKIIRRGVDIL